MSARHRLDDRRARKYGGRYPARVLHVNPPTVYVGQGPRSQMRRLAALEMQNALKHKPDARQWAAAWRERNLDLRHWLKEGSSDVR